MRSPSRVLLIHPGIYADQNPMLFPPWGVLCLGATLRRAGLDVEVVDLNGSLIPESVSRVLANFDPDVVGVTGKLGLGARRFREVVETVGALEPSVRVAAGGPLVASFPDSDHDLWRGVHARFAGDGEDAFLAWLRGGCLTQIDTVHGAPANLDDVGVPIWWDRLQEYVKPAPFWPNMGVASIHIASARGCTRRCTFCYLRSQYPGVSFRFVSALRLIQDLDELAQSLGVQGFYFVDDCFIDKAEARVREFCAAMLAKGAPYRFGCDLQWPDLENLDLLSRMYAAGFRCFYLGLEAASADVRRRLGKGRISGLPSVTLQRVIDMGFLVRASVGIGWPGETVEDVERTLTLIDDVPELLFDAYRYLPLPNMPLSDQWAKTATPAALERFQNIQFQDYSEFNSNFSAISDQEYERLWADLVWRQNRRLSDRFSAIWTG